MSETGAGAREVADVRLAPVPLVSALISEEASGSCRPRAGLTAAPAPGISHRSPGRPPKCAAVGTSHSRIRPVPRKPNHTKPTMMSSMSPFPTCAAVPNTFSVLHLLHGGPVAFGQHQPNMTINTYATTTPTASPSQLASPTVTYSKTRTQPVASPNKKARKSRVVFDFTTEEMAKYFHMSQREAAQKLGVATVTIKRNCRRLGIVWPYRLMKSKKEAINWSAISREDAQRIRLERALERAKAGRSPSSRSRSQSTPSARSSDVSDDEAAAKAMTMLSSCSCNSVELTEAGRAFARLPLDCMDTSN